LVMKKVRNTERTDTKGEMLHFVFDSRLCIYTKAEMLKGKASLYARKKKKLL
jgi:hypothetical protein